jgi:hypothetical protein
MANHPTTPPALEFVTRPVGRTGRGGAPIDQRLVEALKATVDNGQAVPYPVPRAALMSFQQRLRTNFKHLGLRVHVSHDPRRDIATIWCDRLPTEALDAFN